MKIGFMGLGIMGAPMCRNILARGHELTVFNRTASKAEPLREAGAVVAATPAELAEASDVVVTMVTDHGAVDGLLFGGKGALRALRGKTFVNMSTVLPEYSRLLAHRLEENGTRFVDAPVSGSSTAAEKAGLIILAGGDPELVDSLEPLFGAIGCKTVHCGEAGQGSMMKLANNLVLSVMLQGVAEGMRFGIEGNLDRETIMEVLLSGPMASQLLEFKKTMLVQSEFPAQFPLKDMAKDVNLIAETTGNLPLEFPCATAAGIQFNHAVSLGFGEEDCAAIFKLL